MVTKDDIQAFLDRLAGSGTTYTEVSDGLWDLRPGGALDFSVAVHYSPPVVVLRIRVMDLPADSRQTALTRRLLELNATDLLHGSYGIEGDTVILTEALELSHLDFEEFLASYESITLSLASHIRELATFREAR
ncbi:MAG: YbjN domain-containing protein [Gemmatimonadetes bacterium]|nr:YbjN domain-containing protein [Gemmatimonadota bacterium]